MDKGDNKQLAGTVQTLDWHAPVPDKQADTQGAMSLAAMYESGTGVPQNYALARGWYNKAATQGDPVAQQKLAAMYEQGVGGKQDLAQAEYWYQKAADQGQEQARVALQRLDKQACDDPFCTTFNKLLAARNNNFSGLPDKEFTAASWGDGLGTGGSTCQVHGPNSGINAAYPDRWTYVCSFTPGQDVRQRLVQAGQELLRNIRRAMPGDWRMNAASGADDYDLLHMLVSPEANGVTVSVEVQAVDAAAMPQSDVPYDYSLMLTVYGKFVPKTAGL
jgi:TPR repeat protein